MMLTESPTKTNNLVTENPTSESVALRPLLWVAPLAIVLAVAANAVIYSIADALFGVAWLPLYTLSSVVISTIGYLLVATLVFVIVARFAKRPIWLYRRVAFVALLLSLLPPFSALMGMAAPPGIEATAAPFDTFITMLVMHIVAYAISVTLFTRLTRDA